MYFICLISVFDLSANNLALVRSYQQVAQLSHSNSVTSKQQVTLCPTSSLSYQILPWLPVSNRLVTSDQLSYHIVFISPFTVASNPLKSNIMQLKRIFSHNYPPCSMFPQPLYIHFIVMSYSLYDNVVFTSLWYRIHFI